MSLSSSRWILTLVLDINVYDNFITQLMADIKNAKNMTKWISRHYSHTDMNMTIKGVCVHILFLTLFTKRTNCFCIFAFPED